MRRSRLRKNKQRGHVIQEICMTPLVDVALTLLIIFMVATPMMNNIIKIELPSSRINDDIPKSHTQQNLTVYVDKNRTLFFNDQEISQEALLKQLKIVAKKNKEDVVLLRADLSVPYGKVIDLMDTIKISGGIKYVALATKRAL